MKVSPRPLGQGAFLNGEGILPWVSPGVVPGGSQISP
jgi:hypothetical protein